MFVKTYTARDTCLYTLRLSYTTTNSNSGTTTHGSVYIALMCTLYTIASTLHSYIYSIYTSTIPLYSTTLHPIRPPAPYHSATHRPPHCSERHQTAPPRTRVFYVRCWGRTGCGSTHLLPTRWPVRRGPGATLSSAACFVGSVLAPRRLRRAVYL